MTGVMQPAQNKKSLLSHLTCFSYFTGLFTLVSGLHVKSDALCKVLQGEHIVLYKNGKILW